jgi:hypothetical protein
MDLNGANSAAGTNLSRAQLRAILQYLSSDITREREATRLLVAVGDSIEHVRQIVAAIDPQAAAEIEAVRNLWNQISIS